MNNAVNNAVNTLMTCLRNLIALGFAALTSYVLGSISSTYFVIKAIQADIPLNLYASTAMTDIKGQTPYFIVIILGFLMAFLIAAFLRKALPRLAMIGYPLAGAAAIGAALGLMFLQFGEVPITGAKSRLGFFCQMLAGALGGLIFGRLQKPLKANV